MPIVLSNINTPIILSKKHMILVKYAMYWISFFYLLLLFSINCQNKEFLDMIV